MILTGNCLEILPTLDAESVQCCVTSPPYYGLRDYGVAGQIGLEGTHLEYVEKLVQVFREVWRVLRPDGTLWLNLGDSYASGKGTCFNPGGGSSSLGKERKEAGAHPLDRGNKSTLEAVGLKPKDLIGIPWRVAFALQADGWYLRSEIIWHKPNPMPESVTDRPTKSHEQIFLLTKSARYFYDAEAVKEAGTPQHPSALNFARATKEAEIPGQTHKQHRLKRIPTAGKWSQEDPQSSGRRIVESVKMARAQGNEHDNPFGLTRNRRSVWTITTKPFKEAHFATFPPEIPEICIKAGTSEKGCCPECGSPWERVLQRGNLVSVDGTKATYRPTKDTDDPKIKGRSEGWVPNHFRESTTTGWRPTCAHNIEPIPCTVLDPFGGANTTGQVAERLGRKSIIIELNPAYSEMGERREEAVRLPLLEVL